jgi:hypothetical protein
MDILLVVITFLSYFIESIFGFGGTVLFLGLSGFIFDFKMMIHLSIYMGIVFSGTVILQNWKDIEWHLLRSIFLICLPGMIFGTYLIDALPALLLLKIFAVFLILYGLQNLFFPNIKMPKILNTFFVVIGGFFQGLTTTGGPFIVMGVRDKFRDKTSLRASMAVFFCMGNLYRFGQNTVTSGTALSASINYWWVCFPLILAAIIGYVLHKKIPENIFKRTVIVLLTFIGFIFLFK